MSDKPISYSEKDKLYICIVLMFLINLCGLFTTVVYFELQYEHVQQQYGEVLDDYAKIKHELGVWENTTSTIEYMAKHDWEIDMNDYNVRDDTYEHSK